MFEKRFGFGPVQYWIRYIVRIAGGGGLRAFQNDGAVLCGGRAASTRARSEMQTGRPALPQTQVTEKPDNWLWRTKRRRSSCRVGAGAHPCAYNCRRYLSNLFLLRSLIICFLYKRVHDFDFRCS